MNCHTDPGGWVDSDQLILNNSGPEEGVGVRVKGQTFDVIKAQDAYHRAHPDGRSGGADEAEGKGEHCRYQNYASKASTRIVHGHSRIRQSFWRFNCPIYNDMSLV